MFYPDELPEDVKPVDFEFWDEPAHKLWTIELGDEPSAKEVEDIPFSALGFDNSMLDGRIYSGESLDNGRSSDVYETDPKTNKSKVCTPHDRANCRVPVAAPGSPRAAENHIVSMRSLAGYAVRAGLLGLMMPLSLRSAITLC